MSSRLKPFDYFFLTRPILFFPGWATLLAGYITARGDIQIFSSFVNGHIHIEWWNPILAAGIAVFSCAMGGSFVLNQLQDIQSDVKNNKLFLLGEGHISPRAGYIESFILLVLSLLGAFFINHFFFWTIVCFNLLTGYCYNFPPCALKNKPLLGLVANMAMGWLAFCLGWTIVESPNIDFLLSSLPFLFFNTSLYFLTTMPDLEGDKNSGKQTFPVQYGFKFTVVLCLLFFILAMATSLWLQNEFMLVVSALTAPFIIKMAWQQHTASALVAVKSGIACFALMICLKFPSFFVLLALLFFFTRFYYKERFNFDYPNFKGH